MERSYASAYDLIAATIDSDSSVLDCGAYNGWLLEVLAKRCPLTAAELVRVSEKSSRRDTETDTPVHRHLIVFSFRVLRQYLQMIGFQQVSGRGFGLYPFPKFTQPLLERLDPYHCHQMVFVAKRPREQAVTPASLPACWRLQIQARHQ